MEIKNDSLFLIYSKYCGPCHMFLPLWKAFTNKRKTKNTIAIEASYVNAITQPTIKKNVDKMMKVKPYVPNVAKYSMKSNRTYMFNKDRTMENLSLFFSK